MLGKKWEALTRHSLRNLPRFINRRGVLAMKCASRLWLRLSQFLICDKGGESNPSIKDLRWFTSARFGYLSALTTQPINFFQLDSALCPKDILQYSENFERPSLNVDHPDRLEDTVPRLRRFPAIRSRFPRCLLISNPVFTCVISFAYFQCPDLPALSIIYLNRLSILSALATTHPIANNELRDIIIHKRTYFRACPAVWNIPGLSFISVIV
jgi:hypothetical protein